MLSEANRHRQLDFWPSTPPEHDRLRGSVVPGERDAVEWHHIRKEALRGRRTSLLRLIRAYTNYSDQELRIPTAGLISIAEKIFTCHSAWQSASGLRLREINHVLSDRRCTHN
jgi:hypothetical protein